MDSEDEAGQNEALAENAARLRAEVLAGAGGDPSPEEIHRLAGMIEELRRIEALMSEG